MKGWEDYKRSWNKCLAKSVGVGPERRVVGLNEKSGQGRTDGQWDRDRKLRGCWQRNLATAHSPGEAHSVELG